MKQYFIVDTNTSHIVGRLTPLGIRTMAVSEKELLKDGAAVAMEDVLETMGYTIEMHEFAVMPKQGLMGRERRYKMNNLYLAILDTETGKIDSWKN